MKSNKTFRFFGRKAGLLMTAALFAAGLVWSQGCKKGVEEALGLFLSVLVPSLFPFMALSALCVRTGLCARLGRRLERPTRLLFGLNGVFAPVLLLALTGGYPVGARAIAQLYEAGQIREKEAMHAALFCVCAGPGFVLSYIGGLYGNQAVGTVMLTAQVLAVILSGVGLKFLLKNYHISDKEIRAPALPFSTSLVMASKEAAGGMAGIGAMVLLFGAFNGMLTDWLPSEEWRAMILPWLEICTGVTLLIPHGSAELCAFAVGFGGLCVHFQIFAALGRLRVNKALFFSMRIIQGFLTALFTHIGMKLLPAQAVFSTATISQAGFSGGSIISGAALMTVAVVFLFTFKKR